VFNLASTFQKKDWSFKKNGTVSLKIAVPNTVFVILNPDKSKRKVAKEKIKCFQDPVPERSVSATGFSKIWAKQIYFLNQG
jgi:hypothetical protein